MADDDAQGREETRQREDVEHYDGPSGGWGSVEGMGRILAEERPSPAVMDTLLRQNKPGGHMCTSCAWTKPAEPHRFEFCENGAKATIWDLTTARATPDFFRKHTVAELLTWSDHDLEMAGRLTEPMIYDPATDRYTAVSWEDAFQGIGAELRKLDPRSVTFYTSGKAGLEASYLYALFARLYGHNNLPDSSNMCHETTSVGLKKVIGSPVGTCVLSDFDHCDMILFFGQNTGTNSPRFLHPLQEAKKRGCKIVTFNPLRETGLVRFANPQSAKQMLGGSATDISDIYLQVKPGGDIAALMGLCKHVVARDDAEGGILDRGFLAQHCHDVDAFLDQVRATDWAEIETASGLLRDELEQVAEIYADAKNTIGIYGMGLTQHVHGSQSIGMLVNLLLLRGNMGREGAGISPVRGHSNVQGQRTVGISEKPKLVPLDKLAEMYGFEPPREKGRGTIETVEALLDGSLKGFVSLGGNFSRAVPDQGRSDAAWSGLDLNVQIATKLNRSHLRPGKKTWILPCLVRAEEDMQASGPQAVSMEDSLSHIHGSLGKRTPAADTLMSEPAIIAGIAKATLEPNPKVRWDDWIGDYGLIRDLIEETYPDKFKDFNERLYTPGGFYKGNAARERVWKTDSGKAEFTTPEKLTSLGKDPVEGEYTLITLRSNDQFNTTIYGFSDRLRGLKGSREIVLMRPEEIEAAGLSEGDTVTLVCAVDDGHDRRVGGLKIVPYDLPRGCVAAYYPETNPLIPLGYHDVLSKTPAYKGTPVRIER